MSEYQRFISYMYEYQNGQKSANCGYARIERRGQQCRLEIHMKTAPQTEEQPIRIYGCFQEDGVLYGLRIGQHTPVLGMLNWRYQGDASRLNDSAVSLNRLEGLILIDGTQTSYASVWNDGKINPLEMKEYLSKQPPADTAAPAQTPKENSGVMDPPSDTKNTSVPSREVSAAAAETATNKADPDASKSDVLSQYEPGASNDTMQDMKTEKRQSMQPTLREPSDNPMYSQPMRSETPMQSEQSDNPMLSQPMRSETPMQSGQSGNPMLSQPMRSETPGQSDNIVQSVQPEMSDAPAQYKEITDNPMAPSPDNEKINTTVPTEPGISQMPEGSVSPLPDNAYRSAAQNRQTSVPGQQPSAASASAVHPRQNPWKWMWMNFPHMQPFSDGEIRDGIRIEQKDLARLRQNGIGLATNRFILHAFQKYGHLFLGELGEMHILAVPGTYDSQERFLANMFGFPYFKSTGETPVQYGQRGYWYRPLH